MLGRVYNILNNEIKTNTECKFLCGGDNHFHIQIIPENDLPIFVTRDLQNMPPIDLTHIDVTQLTSEMRKLRNTSAQKQMMICFKRVLVNLKKN